MQANFDVSEYTLVFRRVVPHSSASVEGHGEWVVVRPAFDGAGQRALAQGGHEVAQVLVVPLCSTLALDGAAYEHFLLECGALRAATSLLADLPADALDAAETAETARKEIQALVMEAEVQHIVEGMSA